jgi:hypothetical protein
MHPYEILIYCDEYYDEDQEATIAAEILVDPTLILAADREKAQRKAHKLIPDSHDDNEYVVVIVREYN